MRTRMVKLIAASAALWLLCAGCLESTVTNSCTAMSEARCSTCYACALDEDGLSGPDLCGVADGADEAACTDALTQICESQTNARQLNTDDLDACQEKLEANTSCTPLYESATQGHLSLPTQCRVFF